ncbi:MAG: N-6 DNA methylase [Deltaproteobacteria bacterium]|jgi:type I restriction-modification system DNA methylase subunit|nr:N-6 DNA methylase [Deltaproteobacteria bacterium]
MHHVINIKDFLGCLNYSDSPYFFEGPRLEEVNSYSNAFRIAREKCGLKGVYALDGNPGGKSTGKSIVPLVYVCEAESENQAIKTHQLVWNQNCVPFLLVVTPKSIRLYPGFKFDTSKQVHGKDQNLLKIAKSTKEILEKLSDFTADSINKGTIWQKWQHKVTPDTRVDQNLLKNLEKLGGWLRDNDLHEQTAHALIGKYVYLRYLRDRDILSDRKLEQWNFDLNSVFGRNATVSGFQTLVKKIDQWLNGSIFPVPTKGELSPRDEHIKKVASVFLGDDPASRQMHLDFKAYNFAHIPIETLSVVYQQFLHTEKRGRSQGAYYTPVHLVNFILDELDSKKMLKKGMTVFDPACGSGAFIIQCFRRLIERELSTEGSLKLKPSELKILLVDHIFGVDIDEDACGVTELSLVLTLLDYVDPPDLEEEGYQNFKLPILRDKNIFFCKNGFFDDEATQIKALSQVKFDWIVGNPPWNQLSKKSNVPADQSTLTWIKNNKKEYPVNKNQIAEAFVWKASLYLSDDGVTGFLLPGKTLFKTQKNAIEFRERFFNKMDVWCIVNFGNLRRLLFKGAANPAAAFFYRAWQNNSDKPGSILTYAPFAMNQISQYDVSKRGRKRLWTVLVNADEMREIPYRNVLSGTPLPWKMAMWGTMRDKYLLVSLQKTFVNLSTFIKIHDLDISEGPQLRGTTAREKIESLPEVAGKDQLNMKELEGCGRIFSFPKKALKTIPESMAYVRKGRGKRPLNICKPPHIVVDSTRRFSVFSDQFIVVPPRQIGIAGDLSKANLLKALALYLSSDFVQYQQYLSSPSWGIGMGILNKQDLEFLPIPLDKLSPGEVGEWAKLYDELVQQSTNDIAEEQFFKSAEKPIELKPLMNKMNEKVNALLGLKEDEQCLVHDFITIRMEFNDGAIPELVNDLASKAEIKSYSKTLKKVLDDFLDADIRNQHQITANYSSSMVLLSIEHSENPPDEPVIVKKVADAELKEEFKNLEKNLGFEQGQWIYFRKNLKLFHGRTTYFVKSRQRLGWLQSQAFTDADEFIAEKLITTGND